MSSASPREPYWQAFSDYLIHRIHARVLQHVKRETETASERTSGVAHATLVSLERPDELTPQ
jgi:hypothetical protein